MAMDFQKIAKEVYGLAESEEDIAPLVKEALNVIDQGLDTHGCVFFTPLEYLSNHVAINDAE